MFYFPAFRRNQKLFDIFFWWQCIYNQAELGKLARLRLREHMASLTLSREELELLWRLLKRHASPPPPQGEEQSHESMSASSPRATFPSCVQVQRLVTAHVLPARMCPGNAYSRKLRSQRS